MANYELFWSGQFYFRIFSWYVLLQVKIMDRQPIPNTTLYVRNLGKGRSRIMIIEPENLDAYRPIKINNAATILYNDTVIPELKQLFEENNSRPRRHKVIPGGIGSAADEGLRKFLGVLSKKERKLLMLGSPV